MCKTYRIDESEAGAYDMDFLEYDKEAGTLTNSFGVEYDQEDFDNLGVNLIDEFEKSDEDLLCFRNDELEVEIEITEK